ncbi:succinyldiaminopimelate transaminase [Amycolatopsis speibonae]
MIGELPAFPWSALMPLRALAAGHPGGIVNLALGTPVDPSPDVARAALAAAADAPGHPATEGTPEFREAATRYLKRRLGAEVAETAVLPAVGTKELIAWLPAALGLGPGDTVAYPRLSFPTYDVSARLAGATPQAVDLTAGPPAFTPKLLWLNSPSNPDGRILTVAELREYVEWGRKHGVLVVNDECYIEHGWTAEPVSILHPDVSGPGHEGVLAVHSLSKRSNMAGYRAGFVAGDERLVRTLLEVRRHAGLIVPAPIAAAMTAALNDDDHVAGQRLRYLRRRTLLLEALLGRGFRVDGSAGSLFLWATEGRPCWDTTRDLAELGILVAPGEIYGPAGEKHVRLALTATDERIETAVTRLRR